jgi:Zn-dependent M28 family amino/carboxypeptidase
VKLWRHIDVGVISLTISAPMPNGEKGYVTVCYYSKSSQGAVDNGAACAILLGLAERVANGKITLEHTRLTLALFTGEEVNLQGSRAYARGRAFPLPTLAVNLEIMAQNGAYVYWEQDGSVFKLYPTSELANQALRDAVRR